MEQLNLFGASQEKGSSEWSAFNAIRFDRAGTYRVATPIERQPRYSNVVSIRRYKQPHQLFPKPAH